MKRTCRMLSAAVALVLCVATMIPLCASAAEATDDGWQCVVATPTQSEGSQVSPHLDLDSNGTGYLHYNDILDSAYAETKLWGWTKDATYMFAKITIGTRSLTKSYNGNGGSIKTNKLYADSDEKLALSNHTITTTRNGTQVLYCIPPLLNSSTGGIL